MVIRSSGDDAYNPYIMELSQQKGNTPLNSVRTILFKNAKASSEQEVLDVLSNAEAIFLAGGDQSDYLSFWSGTQVQSILQSKVRSQGFYASALIIQDLYTCLCLCICFLLTRICLLSLLSLILSRRFHRM